MSKAERNWKLWMRAFVGYDDNVQEIGKQGTFRGDNGSAVLGYTAEGAVWTSDGPYLAGIGMRFDQLLHTKSAQGPVPAGFFSTDANDFDFTILNPALFFAYQVERTPLPLTLKAVYDFRYETAETLGGSFHTISFGIGTEFTPEWTADIMYSHGWDDHGVTYAPPATHVLNDRDGQRDSVTLSTAYVFNASRSRFILLYGFLKNDSDGRNFAYEGSRVSARLESVLVGPLFGAIQFGYENRDYVSPFFAAPGRSNMDLYTFEAQLLLKLSRQWALDWFYNYTSYQTDSAIFESDRHIGGMGIRYDF